MDEMRVRMIRILTPQTILCVFRFLYKKHFSTLGRKDRCWIRSSVFFFISLAILSIEELSWRVELQIIQQIHVPNRGRLSVCDFFLFWTFDNFHFILKCIFAAFCDKTLEFILLSVIVYTSLGSINIFPKFQYGFLECNTCHVFEQNILSLQVYLSVFTRRSKYMVENIIIFPSSYTKYSSAFLIRLPNSNLS